MTRAAAYGRVASAAHRKGRGAQGFSYILQRLDVGGFDHVIIPIAAETEHFGAPSANDRNWREATVRLVDWCPRRLEAPFISCYA